MQVAKVVSAADGGVTVTGRKATIVGGGPDGGSLLAISGLQEQYHP